MKKALALFFGLSVLAASSSYAGTTPDASSHGRWFIQAEGGIGIPASNELSSDFLPGFTGELQAGYSFSDIFMLSVEGGIDSLPFNIQKFVNQAEQQYGITGATGTTTVALTHIPLEVVGQFRFPLGGSVTPYLILGVGVAFDSAGGNVTVSYLGYSATQSIPSQSWTNFELDPGLGVDLALSGQFRLFLQAKCAMDFGSISGSNPESTDNPIIGIPIQIGVNFTFK